MLGIVRKEFDAVGWPQLDSLFAEIAAVLATSTASSSGAVAASSGVDSSVQLEIASAASVGATIRESFSATYVFQSAAKRRGRGQIGSRGGAGRAAAHAIGRGSGRAAGPASVRTTVVSKRKSIEVNAKATKAKKQTMP